MLQDQRRRWRLTVKGTSEVLPTARCEIFSDELGALWAVPPGPERASPEQEEVSVQLGESTLSQICQEEALGAIARIVHISAAGLCPAQECQAVTPPRASASRVRQRFFQNTWADKDYMDRQFFVAGTLHERGPSSTIAVCVQVLLPKAKPNSGLTALELEPTDGRYIGFLRPGAEEVAKKKWYLDEYIAVGRTVFEAETDQVKKLKKEAGWSSSAVPREGLDEDQGPPTSEETGVRQELRAPASLWNVKVERRGSILDRRRPLVQWLQSSATIQEIETLWHLKQWVIETPPEEMAETLARRTRSGWFRCSYEHQLCVCKTRQIRFGHAARPRRPDGHGREDVRNFGGRDPVEGYLKQCQCYTEDLPVEGALGTTAGLPVNVQYCGFDLSVNWPWAKSGPMQEYLGRRNYLKWTSEESEWIEEGFVTYMGGEVNSNYEWMATNLLRSTSLFSTRPIIVVVTDSSYRPPAWWAKIPNVILFKMASGMAFPVSFNFNKIRSMIAARVIVGIQLDVDQLVAPGIDHVFRATRLQCTQKYPFPIMPVHWMSRDAEPLGSQLHDPRDLWTHSSGSRGEQFYEYRLQMWDRPHGMRWCHAHPTWTYWALLFLANVLLKRYLVALAPDFAASARLWTLSNLVPIDVVDMLQVGTKAHRLTKFKARHFSHQVLALQDGLLRSQVVSRWPPVDVLLGAQHKAL
eukprot:g7263.t1